MQIRIGTGSVKTDRLWIVYIVKFFFFFTRTITGIAINFCSIRWLPEYAKTYR
jgi:hypothetical protein